MLNSGDKPGIVRVLVQGCLEASRGRGRMDVGSRDWCSRMDVIVSSDEAGQVVFVDLNEAGWVSGWFPGFEGSGVG